MSNTDPGNSGGKDLQVQEAEIYEFPCSLAQSRFWVLDQITPENPALNVAVRWRLQGRIDVPVLQQALNAVIDRHEILRTAYRDVDGEPVQLVMPEALLQLPVIDLTLLPERARLEERERISLIEARKPFDLTAVPNLRATLLKVGAEEHIILVTVHHIASDGWSVGIIARDMMEFYEASLKGRAPQLSDLPLQYADFAVWQTEWIKVDDLKAERDYWTTQLAGFQPFDLPTDKPHSAGSAPAVIAGRQLPRTLTDAMTALATSEGCTFFMVGASALVGMLYSLTGQEDITLGTQIAGRDRVELNNVIGPFINTVPLRVDAGGTPSFRQLLGRMHDVIEGALVNQRMPIEDIVAIVKPIRDPGRNPLFSVNVICQRSFIPTDVRPDLTLIDMPSVSPGALYDLNFFFVERPDGWRMSCEYNTSLYNAATAEGYLLQLHGLLESFIADPDQPIPERQAAPARAIQPVRPLLQAPTIPATTREGVEAQLAEICKTVLKIPTPGRTDNFFALGGHSLTAFRLLSRVEKIFDKRIPFEDLYTYPTIAGLANLIVGEPEAQSDNVVVMQPLGDKTPILAVHDTFIFQDLADRLGGDRPFISIPVPDFIETRPQIPYSELATHYLRAIEEVRPRGPYILLGFCFAARLSFEIARQLVAKGERVELLVAIDAWAPKYLMRQSRLRAFLAEFSYRIQKLGFYVGLFFKGAEGRKNARRRMGMFSRKLLAAIGLNSKPDADIDEITQRNKWIDQAGHSQETKQLPVPILSIHNADMPLGAFLDKTMGWQALTTEHVTMASVPGSHSDLLRRAGSTTIANIINATLKRQPGQQ
ncbi:hypothetical protein GCM10007874_23530 [Labrys miyagiensis]|uniref:Carrier domain-containing protein n=1 Tax=Labrys miyagiensis TaxID=346912 RepID=A0ABQ6CGH6_9HYPH|nr:condensation domain-containing protein [Labrys miyagiensis]GLS19336.1 hypothetical protein GCM10007874_23530 [Labrys miyagiensis]